LEVGSFSYWFDKPWFHTEGRLAAVLIIPSSWGSQLGGHLHAISVYCRSCSLRGRRCSRRGATLLQTAASVALDGGRHCSRWRAALLPTSAGARCCKRRLAAGSATNGGGNCYEQRWGLLPMAVGSATNSGGCCYQWRRDLLPTVALLPSMGRHGCQPELRMQQGGWRGISTLEMQVAPFVMSTSSLATVGGAQIAMGVVRCCHRGAMCSYSVAAVVLARLIVALGTMVRRRRASPFVVISFFLCRDREEDE
jgi:hypothetical protein